MANQRPNLSITLPSNLSLSSSTIAPRTPERLNGNAPVTPSVAQTTQARFRLRRRPGGRALSAQLFTPPSPTRSGHGSEIPIPSIEVASDAEDFGTADGLSAITAPGQRDGFLSPLSSQLTYHEPPTTPLGQTTSFDGNNWSTARQRELGESILRPMSQCSMWSNSSDESDSYSTVASSYGTSCTSPERLAGDPFFTPSKDDGFSQSLLDAGRIPELVTPKPRSKTSWSPAMDDHLWTAYQLYLQDPTATPIKTLPGNAPPLGVCHRVARQAKSTWKEPKLRSSANRFTTPQPAGSPKMDIPQDPVAADVEAQNHRPKPSASATWPRLGATRRRLRELAKNRATIAPHYMRLIAGRTPSPFSSSSAQSASSRHTSAPAPGSRRRPVSRAPESMESRDVRLALVTATSETMHPDGPLAQLQRSTPQPSPEPANVSASTFDFNFNEPAVPFASPIPIPSSAVERSSSVDHLMPDASSSQPPRLGSPFVPNHSHTWAAPRSQPVRGNLPSSFQLLAQPEQEARHLPRPSTSTGPRSLRSPIHFTSSFPYNRSLGSKRRAEHSLEDTHQRHVSHHRPELNVEELFGPPLQSEGAINRDGARSPVEQRRVRVRGFSLGDAIMQSQQDRQDAMDVPGALPVPDADDPFVEGRDIQANSLSGLGSIPTLQRSLGSPFRAAESSARPRKFRVRHFAHNSLGSYPEDLFGSIGERLEGDE